MHSSEFIIDSSIVETQPRSWGSARELIDKRDTASGCGISISKITYNAPHHSGIHSDDEAIYVLAGTGEALVAKQAIPVHPGVLIVIPAGTDHGMRPAEGETLEAIAMHYLGRK